MVEASCHCGAVVLELAEPPEDVFDCNCSICRRLGVLWAYCATDRVRIRGAADATFAYVWGDRTLEFRTCRTCGCTTHWQAIDVPNPTRMGVNARLVDGLSAQSVRMHRLDGAGTGKFWS